jgi:hypothetical protein
MILASFDHAEADIEARQLVEAKNEAETILGAVAKGKDHAAWRMLSPEEIAAVETAESELKALSGNNDYRAVRAGIERLDQATRRFAELMMDTTLAGAMKGQTMESASEGLGAGPSAPHPFAKAQFDEAKKDEDDRG